MEGQLVPPLRGLDQAKDEVADVEGASLDPAAMVPSECLLVLGGMKEGDVPGFIELIQRVLQVSFVSSRIVGFNSWGPIIQVGREYGFRSVDHEERGESRRAALARTQAPEN